MNKCYFKRPGENAIIKEFDYNEPLNDTLEQKDFYVGHALLLRTQNIYWYAFFDDNGIIDYHNGLLKYNCNLPSYGEFQNQIFGNLVIMKIKHVYDQEYCIDITQEDLEYLNSILYSIDSSEIYKKEDVKRWQKRMLEALQNH